MRLGWAPREAEHGISMSADPGLRIALGSGPRLIPREGIGHDDAAVEGKHDGGRPVTGPELGEDGAHVTLDRGLADEEGRSDLGVGRSPGHQSQHVEVPRTTQVGDGERRNRDSSDSYGELPGTLWSWLRERFGRGGAHAGTQCRIATHQTSEADVALPCCCAVLMKEW